MFIVTIYKGPIIPPKLGEYALTELANEATVPPTTRPTTPAPTWPATEVKNRSIGVLLLSDSTIMGPAKV